MNGNRIENILSEKLKRVLENENVQTELQEIRLRVDKPIMIYWANKEFFIGTDLKLHTLDQNSLCATNDDIKEVLEYISKHSLYAYEEDIRNGYITIEGGHRIGLAGKVVLENGKVKTIRNVSCINIRVSHEIKGSADHVLPYIVTGGVIHHTLIISPPKCGKTTLLRDIVRQVSDGFMNFHGVNVGLVDERSEIGGCYRGIPQNDIGKRTDILDSCNKGEGLLMLIRAMAPQVIALDEIGNKDDIDAIEYAINAGCKIICTVHGNSIKDIKDKPRLQELIERKLFQRYIFLENQNNIGDIKKIYDEDHKMVSMLVDKRMLKES
ncbi:MAG: stage III sporulation protein AA [Firmicutes bacterium HGW-Firmicutes-7]|nr:MAG: stage III sporulation protein AA [Firmicutes bacterium HGW-Firmicutes-7]